MNILGIETSCDETGVAVVTEEREILSDMLLSQIKTHEVFGGVVPEVAARSHLEHLDGLIAAALKNAGLGVRDLDGIAATCGPGLIGGVMVGMMAGKTLALATGKPFIGVNHLEAHLLSPRLLQDIPFPYLALLVSGGHTQILVAEDVGHYALWGTTLDDAVGECFDKTAKMMGLPYPGGPHIEKQAAKCEDGTAATMAYPFPIPLAHSHTLDFSFSGLKTSLRHAYDRLSQPEEEEISALAFSLQETVSRYLALRAGEAMKRFKTTYPLVSNPCFVVCGGVASNKTIRSRLQEISKSESFSFLAPPPRYCTDNGVMVAWAGIERIKRGHESPLDMPARPRWPLESLKEQGKERSA